MDLTNSIKILICFQTRNCCVNCNSQFGEYHCGMCNLWMSLVRQRVSFLLSIFFVKKVRLTFVLNDIDFRLGYTGRARSPFIVTGVDFVAWEEWKHFAIATNAACAFQLVSLILISASRTSTRITARSAEKTCSLRDSLLRIYHVDTLSMLIASASWLVSIIVAPSVKRRSCRSRAWPPLGRPGPEILQNILCLLICSVSLTLCVTIARQRVTG